MSVHPKVAASTAAAALTQVVVFTLGELGVDVPVSVADSLTVLFVFAAGWFVRGPVNSG